MAIYANLYVDQGSSYYSTITVEGAVGIVDLTGYTAAGQIRKTYNSTNFVDFDITIVEPRDKGELLIELSPATTESMKSGRYVYDIEITNTNTAEVFRVIEGQVEINPSVTRA